MLSSREQVAAIALAVERRDPRQQPFFGRRVRFDDAVLEDMADGKTAPGEAARHQQTAMTIKRFAFRAHQANTGMRCGVDQAIEAGAKFGLRRHRLVVGGAIAIEAFAAGAAAERITAQQVGDAFLRKPRLEVLAREPGTETRRRHGAHVGYGIHRGDTQQR